MKQGMSSLNPYAASYVPLAKREAHSATSFTGREGSMYHDGMAAAASFQSPPKHVMGDHFHSRTFASEKMPEAFQVKTKPASSSYSLSPLNAMDSQFPDDDPDMEIEYLRMEFPGISEQSLRDVYMVNQCDLDAAVEMLNQLELQIDVVESSGSLPDTLDIGDFSESGTSSDAASLKLKNVAAEAGTSSTSAST